MTDIRHIRTFIFDLDNTLYHPRTGLMDQMHTLIGLYIMRFMGVDAAMADQIRRRYWQKYGTTMAGLVAEHGVDPHQFMEFVHNIDLSEVNPCARTRELLAALPGRRVIFTNADHRHAERMLTHLGIADLFEEVYDVTRVGFTPKPALQSYEKVLGWLGEEGQHCAMLEDSLENLRPAHALGMTTIWVTDAQEDHPFVHYRTPDVLTWLEGVSTHEHGNRTGHEPREDEDPQGRRHPA
ncbi:MAG: pyrimidine 5'-nucleotidase [Proteobacteria bacterium]|nr:pyrimidine 5'-nucleotidase [Pseudomonadota bacterium]